MKHTIPAWAYVSTTTDTKSGLGIAVIHGDSTYDTKREAKAQFSMMADAEKRSANLRGYRLKKVNITWEE